MMQMIAAIVLALAMATPPVQTAQAARYEEPLLVEGVEEEGAEPEEAYSREDAEPEYELVHLGEYKITHYCVEPHKHICNNGDASTTATGEKPVPYETIAVDPKVIPYGSVVAIGGKEYRANDCGGGIKGNRIDIAVTTHKEALQLGVKHEEVYLKVETAKG